MKNWLRSFIALWYLLGWMSHVYLGFWAPEVYVSFGNTALFPWVAALWQRLVMPHITFFALLLAVVEILVGLALISRGKWVKVGLIVSITFNLGLVLLGLGMPAETVLQDFLGNRLPNLIFIALQIPLLWAVFDESIPQTLQSWFQGRTAPKAAGAAPDQQIESDRIERKE